MSTAEMLDEIQQKALEDEKLRRRLLDSAKEKNPLEAFYRICREAGYELYPMEVVQAGKRFTLLCAAAPTEAGRILRFWRERTISTK